ncbi:MAG TPA: hypothetical protein VEK57_12415 [Thermoanaerobaculia bacterium]|nr:hypothetical protein [Thermoanaerobaculia bacterium]
MKVRLALALAFLPVVASAALVVAPERTVSDPSIAAAAGTQWTPVLASSGTETVVAWLDSSAGRDGVYVAALSQRGELIAGSQLWLARGSVNTLRIAWTGETYLLLWNDERGIIAASLDRERRVLAAPRLVLPGAQLRSDTRWNGKGALVVYAVGGAPRAALLDRDGNVELQDMFVPSEVMIEPVIATDGSSFFVFWRQQEIVPLPGPPPVLTKLVESIYVTRFSTAGVSTSGAMKVAVTDQLAPGYGVAYDGRHFALAAVEVFPNRQLRRVTIDPSTLGTGTLPPVAAGGYSGPGVEWTGSSFVAYWTEYDHSRYSVKTLAFRSDASGDTAPKTVVAGSGSATDAQGTWTGRALAIAWTDRSTSDDGSSDIFGTIADRNGVPETASATAFPISHSHQYQTDPAIAANGAESLVVWTEGNGGYAPATLLAARTTGGATATPVVLSESASPGTTVVVFTGSSYFVFWREWRDISGESRMMMRRVSTAGAPLGDAVLVAATHSIAAAWNGSFLLAAYPSGGDLLAVRFTPGGERLDSIPIVLAGKRYPSVVAAASNGEDFLVVWTEGSDHWQWPSADLIDVAAVRVNPFGLVLGPQLGIATGPANQFSPAVASDGQDYMIAWVSFAEGHPDGTLNTRYLGAEGVLGGSIPVDTIPADWYHMQPAIAGTTNGYLLAWQDIDPATAHLRLARLDRTGMVVETTGSLAASLPLLAMRPQLTSVGRHAQLVYSRIVDDPVYGGAMRLFARSIIDGGPRRRTVR